MNNFIYPPANYHQIIIEELRKINNTLTKIEKKTSHDNTKKEKNYLEKDQDKIINTSY